MRFFTVISCLLVFFIPSVAQLITHGPVVGGVTPASARMYIRTRTAKPLWIELDRDSAFSSPVLYTGFTDPLRDTSAIINLDSLEPGALYYYRVRAGNGQQYVYGRFKTFPCEGEPGNYTVLFGSCMNNNLNDDRVFQEAMHHHPDLFLQIGDWTYNDITDNLPSNNDFFPADYNRVIAAYRMKYSYRYMREFLKTVAVDYVWDDHDYVNDNTSRNTASYPDFNPLNPQVLEIPFPPGTRRNAIKGYYEYFPGYPPVDSSEGIFHKFRMGNIEFFMLDNRSARSPNTEAIQRSGNQWVFNPPPDHSIIGDVQRAWLLDNLRKSTATWKFIITATAFNKTYRDAAIAITNLPGAGATEMTLLATIIDSWSGFPLDQDTLISVVTGEGIDGVVMLSGDTHTAAMDDGGSGGLPEVMAGCLSQVNSTLFNTVPLMAFGLQWNQGGQGIGNVNTKDAFGKLEVFGDDSLRMSLVDEDGGVIASFVKYSCSYLSGLKISLDTIVQPRCYGDSSGLIKVKVQGGSPPWRFSVNGRSFQNDSIFTNLPAGVYRIAVKDSANCTRELCVHLDYPEPLRAGITVTPVNCAGQGNGSIAITPSGGVMPYAIQWSNGSTNYSIDSLSAGIYSMTLTDNNGCTLEDSIQVDQPDSLLINILYNDVDCYGGSSGWLMAVPSGGTPPYHYQWSNGVTSHFNSGLPAGNYRVTVTDSRGCTVSGEFNLSQAPAITIDISVSHDSGGLFIARASVYGGIPPYAYEWSDGTIGDSLVVRLPGFYGLTVTDFTGCSRDTVIFISPSTIVQSLTGAPFIQIQPNPIQQFIYITMLKNSQSQGYCQLAIYDYTGTQVFYRNEPVTGLINGKTIRLDDLPQGIYILKISFGNHVAYRKVVKI